MPHTEPPTWSIRRRAVVSAIVAFHVTAVFVGPFAASPSSALGERTRAVLRPYLEAANLNYGYRFFNIPGPSHRVQYRVEFADGRPAVEGIFPDRREHWPRLRYHRYFMLTEALQAMSNVPPEPPPRTRPGDPLYEEWKRARDEFNRTADKYAESYARHLLAMHNGKRVTLWGIERGLPSMEDVRAGTKIDDKRFVYTVKLGTFDGSWEPAK